jgi:hypothetical protein
VLRGLECALLCVLWVCVVAVWRAAALWVHVLLHLPCAHRQILARAVPALDHGGRVCAGQGLGGGYGGAVMQLYDAASLYYIARDGACACRGEETNNINTIVEVHWRRTMGL